MATPKKSKPASRRKTAARPDEPAQHKSASQQAQPASRRSQPAKPEPRPSARPESPEPARNGRPSHQAAPPEPAGGSTPRQAAPPEPARGSSLSAQARSRRQPPAPDPGQQEPGPGPVSPDDLPLSRMTRAEGLADYLIARAGDYGNRAEMLVMGFLTRIREEVEDIWAEANARRLNPMRY